MYTMQTMPQKFRDIKILCEDKQFKTKVHRNERNMLPNVTSGMLSMLI